MIQSLSIQDFVLIRRFCADIENGFTALTGETGAGKSILLDALGVALGGRPEKRLVRPGAERAIVSVSLAPDPDHEVWSLLEARGLAADVGEMLTLRRVIPEQGPARGFVNDEPVSAALLADIGECLVEIHGQQSAMGLLNPARHRDLLDRYAGNEALLVTCREAFEALAIVRRQRSSVAETVTAARANQAFLGAAVDELEGLAPQLGETDRLTALRRRLIQQERTSETVDEALSAIEEGDLGTWLARIAAQLEKLHRSATVSGEDGWSQRVSTVAAGFERAAIEFEEAHAGLSQLAHWREDDDPPVDEVEARLFALKAAARKYGVEPDDLRDHADKLAAELALIEAGDTELATLEAAEAEAAARWHAACDRLRSARMAAASRLKTAVEAELVPLKMGRVRFATEIEPLDDDQAGRFGADRVEIHVETNPGHGLQPLRKIASGGELARCSLALRCALANGDGAQTLIFDEVDHGVGGAVAAAIGERLASLSQSRQVLAITHSPQVAASAAGQWRIEKQEGDRGLGQTEIAILNDTARREEIARMLSGAVVTKEARAAAEQLLERA